MKSKSNQPPHHASQSKDPQPWGRDKQGKIIPGLAPKEVHVSQLMSQSLQLPGALLLSTFEHWRLQGPTRKRPLTPHRAGRTLFSLTHRQSLPKGTILNQAEKANSAFISLTECQAKFA